MRVDAKERKKRYQPTRINQHFKERIFVLGRKSRHDIERDFSAKSFAAAVKSKRRVSITSSDAKRFYPTESKSLISSRLPEEFNLMLRGMSEKKKKQRLVMRDSLTVYILSTRECFASSCTSHSHMLQI